MPTLRPRNLNQALGRLLAAVIVPLLLGTLGVLALQARQEHRLAQARLTTLAQTLLLASDAEFERGRSQLEVLAAAPQIDARDWPAMYRYAREVTRRVPGSLILLVGPDGSPVFNTAATYGEPLANVWTLADQARVIPWEGRPLPASSGNLSRRVFQTGQVQYSDLYYGMQISRPALAVSVPVVREGKVRYALIMSYSSARLQDLVRMSISVPEVRAGLVDRSGRVVASNDAASTRVGQKAIDAGIPAGSYSGSYRAKTRDGVDVVGTYAVSRRNGFVVRVSQPETTTLLPTGLASLAWALLLLAAIVASVMLASLFSRRLARPLRELGDDVRAGRAPSLDKQAGIAEIDLLAQALRDGAMAERQRAEEHTLRTVAENQELLLRQADRQKDEFLATLAHELRNPLAPIRTAVELIRRRAPADPMVERARASIERQTLHLSRLVDDLLDVSRITLGRIQLREEIVDLGTVAAAAVEAIGEAALAGSVTVAQDISPSATFVMGDATRLAQCLSNVLNNAVKFTPAGGHVQVRVAPEGGMAVVEVRDTGVGISADNLHRIFDLFVQERHSGHQGNTGLGIGLALTRRLLELHGGTIVASSEGLGKGSTFRIELPIVEAPVAPAPTAAPPVSACETSDADSGGCRVLVVDDNRDASETLGELLGMSGYVVAVAEDGASALRALTQHRPDVVLLDIGLPDMDGYEVCRRIRGDAAVANQPLLVALTGWGQQGDKDAAARAGFDAHLTKPVDLEALLRMLQERATRR